MAGWSFSSFSIAIVASAPAVFAAPKFTSTPPSPTVDASRAKSGHGMLRVSNPFSVRDRLGDHHRRPVGQHQGAVRPLGGSMYRFLLTVAIALVVWALLAGLAALLGFM